MGEKLDAYISQRIIYIPDPVAFFKDMTPAELAGCPEAGFTADYILELRSQVELWKQLYAQARDNLREVEENAYQSVYNQGIEDSNESHAVDEE